jgi:hypothetical protein
MTKTPAVPGRPCITSAARDVEDEGPPPWQPDPPCWWPNRAGSVACGPRYGVRRRMPRSSSLRASDAERDAVAERLRQAAAEGRLDTEELEERLDVALRARTYGELRRLVADLPGRRQRSSAPTAFAVALRALMAVIVVGAVVALLVMAAAWWAFWMVVWFAFCGRHRRRGSMLLTCAVLPGRSTRRAMRSVRAAPVRARV